MLRSIQAQITDYGRLHSVTGIVVIPANGPGGGLYARLMHESRRYRFVGNFPTVQGPLLAVFDTA